MVYWTASYNNLWQLEIIHNAELRLALGGFCTSLSLEERRLKLSMQDYLKLLHCTACIDNSALHVLHEFNWTTRDLSPGKMEKEAWTYLRPDLLRQQGRGSHVLCRDQRGIVLPLEKTKPSTRSTYIRSKETRSHWRGEQLYDNQSRSPSQMHWVLWHSRITWWPLHQRIQVEQETGWLSKKAPSPQSSNYLFAPWSYSHYSEVLFLFIFSYVKQLFEFFNCLFCEEWITALLTR